MSVAEHFQINFEIIFFLHCSSHRYVTVLLTRLASLSRISFICWLCTNPICDFPIRRRTFFLISFLFTQRANIKTVTDSSLLTGTPPIYQNQHILFSIAKAANQLLCSSGMLGSLQSSCTSTSCAHTNFPSYWATDTVRNRFPALVLHKSSNSTTRTSND